MQNLKVHQILLRKGVVWADVRRHMILYIKEMSGVARFSTGFVKWEVKE